MPSWSPGSNSHIRSISRSSFYDLKNTSRVLPHLSESSAETLIHAFITSCLDYCSDIPLALHKLRTHSSYLQQVLALHHPHLTYKPPHALSLLYLFSLILPSLHPTLHSPVKGLLAIPLTRPGSFKGQSLRCCSPPLSGMCSPLKHSVFENFQKAVEMLLIHRGL